MDIDRIAINCLDKSAESFALQLAQKLTGGAVPHSDWDAIDTVFQKYGVWNGKWSEDTVNRLKDQVATGETVIYELEGDFSGEGADPRVARTSWTVAVDVFSPDGTQHLLEYNNKKKGADLQPKMEGGKIVFGISEKRPVTETVEKAALRALDEELGIKDVEVGRFDRSVDTISLLYKPDERNFFVALAVHTLSIRLTEQEYKEKYAEDRNGFHNEFVWKPVA